MLLLGMLVMRRELQILYFIQLSPCYINNYSCYLSFDLSVWTRGTKRKSIDEGDSTNQANHKLFRESLNNELPDTLNQTQELFKYLLDGFPTDGSAQDCSIIFHRDQEKKPPNPKNSKPEDCANYLPTMLRNIGMESRYY